MSDNEALSDVDVDFEFAEIKEIDYQGIKTLLKQLFTTLDLDLHLLSDLIVEQPKGTIVKVEDSDPYCLSTILDFKHKALTRLKNFLKSKNSKITEYLDNAGFLVNERLINMPPQLVPPLFKLLLDEFKQEFKYLVMVIKVYRQIESNASDDEDEKPKKKKQKKDESIYYFQPEDEYIEEHAVFSFDYKLPTKQSPDSRGTFSEFGIDPSRRVLVIEMKSLPKIQEQLQKLFC
ncbi:p21-C-terminal region-binding protein-domain-containing protein [Gorgonomyces haynaldii]|nr:p21-C-terminal region-binding protein-domain-containing protein [Gorgonomyces haynaldii]